MAFKKKSIDNLPPDQIFGLFDDEGNKIDETLINKPPLCITCVHDGDPNEEILCNMTRFDQRNEQEFKCFAYKKKSF